MSTPSIAPHDVLVIASRSDISAIHVVDGAVLWVHSVADAWPLVNIGIPFLSRPTGSDSAGCPTTVTA